MVRILLVISFVGVFGLAKGSKWLFKKGPAYDVIATRFGNDHNFIKKWEK